MNINAEIAELDVLQDTLIHSKWYQKHKYKRLKRIKVDRLITEANIHGLIVCICAFASGKKGTTGIEYKSDNFVYDNNNVIKFMYNNITVDYIPRTRTFAVYDTDYYYEYYDNVPSPYIRERWEPIENMIRDTLKEALLSLLKLNITKG